MNKIDQYRRGATATAIALAKNDPQLVKTMIAHLRKTGQIEAGDLVYLDQIADRWIQANALFGASDHPRQTRG